MLGLIFAFEIFKGIECCFYLDWSTSLWLVSIKDYEMLVILIFLGTGLIESFETMIKFLGFFWGVQDWDVR